MGSRTFARDMRTNFLISLIQELKEKKIIREGITLPYMLGSFKIKDKYNSTITKEYVCSVLNEILEYSETRFWIYTCSSIDQLVIKPIYVSVDVDIVENGAYRNICNKLGTPVLYFEEAFPIDIICVDNVADYILSTYKEQLIYEKYSFMDNLWVPIPDGELAIINELVNDWVRI